MSKRLKKGHRGSDHLFDGDGGTVATRKLMTDLPCEMLLELFKRIPLRELLSIEQTCKKMKNMTDMAFKDINHLVFKDLPHHVKSAKESRRIINRTMLRCGPNLKSCQLFVTSNADCRSKAEEASIILPYQMSEQCPNLEEITIADDKQVLLAAIRYATAVNGGSIKTVKYSGDREHRNSRNNQIDLEVFNFFKICKFIQKLQLKTDGVTFCALSNIVCDQASVGVNFLQELDLKVGHPLMNLEPLIKIINASPNLTKIRLDCFISSSAPKLFPVKKPKNLKSFHLFASPFSLRYILKIFNELLTELTIHSNRIFLDSAFGNGAFNNVSKLTICGFMPNDTCKGYSFPSLEHFEHFPRMLRPEILSSGLASFIRLNGQALQTIVLRDICEDFQALLSTIHTSCPDLKQLSLHFNKRHKKWAVNITEELINVLKMPLMQKLEIHGTDKTPGFLKNMTKGEQTYDCEFQYHQL